MKKIILSLLITSCASHSNFYVKAGVGIENTNTKNKLRAKDNTVQQDSKNFKRSHLNTFLFGLGKQNNFINPSLFLENELIFKIRNANFKNNVTGEQEIDGDIAVTNGSRTLTIGNSAGFYTHVGYKITENVSIYSKKGFFVSEFSLNDKTKVKVNGLDEVQNTKETLHGFKKHIELGAGFSYKLNDSYSLTLEGTRAFSLGNKKIPYTQSTISLKYLF